MSQLALPLTLADHAVFETFWAGGNEPVVAFLERLAQNPEAPGAWLWGAHATGRSHLLQAVCARLGDRSVYVPLQDLAATGPGILDGLATRACVCLDDVDSVAGRQDWEQGLFGLCNAAADAGVALLAAAAAPSREAGFELRDLQSRFSRLPAFHLKALDDAGRQRALQLRASRRGLELPAETARYLLTRSRRDMASLYSLLDRLDTEALKAQRRLTVPFVRDVLESS